jgi:hypothetical protein
VRQDLLDRQDRAVYPELKDHKALRENRATLEL